MNKKKIGIIGLGASILGATFAFKLYKNKKNESPLNKISTQSNIINNSIETLENHFNELDSLKISNIDSMEKNKKTLILYKNIQKQLKIVNNLKNIENVPEDMIDINEDLETVKFNISSCMDNINLFNEHSIESLKSYLSVVKSSMDLIETDIEDYKLGQIEEKAILIKDNNKKSKNTYSNQRVKFEDYKKD